MRVVNSFDIAESVAASRIQQQFHQALRDRRYSKYIGIDGVTVAYHRRKNAYTRRIEYTIFNDPEHSDTILQDCVVEFSVLPSQVTVSEHVADRDHKLVDYQAALLLTEVKQARKAYKVYTEHQKDVLVPILIRVLP